MSDLPRRPISIWIAQILILLLGIPITLVVIAVSLREWSWILSNDMRLRTLAVGLVATILRFGVIALFAFAFIGLVRRKRYGRWLTVAGVSLMFLFSVIGLIFRPNGPFKYEEYENSAQLMGGIFATLIIYGLLGLLICHLVASDSVSDFFAPPETSAEPPSPLTFFPDGVAEENTSATN